MAQVCVSITHSPVEFCRHILCVLQITYFIYSSEQRTTEHILLIYLFWTFSICFNRQLNLFSFPALPILRFMQVFAVSTFCFRGFSLDIFHGFLHENCGSTNDVTAHPIFTDSTLGSLETICMPY